MTILRDEALSACGVSATDSILVAFSGGADSTALLLEMKRLETEGKIRLVGAAHLNHGIRGAEADRDEAFCKTLCTSLSVPFFTEHADVPSISKSMAEPLEVSGRKARYSFLNRTREQNGFDWVAAAHHKDDQAETILMHLLRGCGTDGLSGMKPQNDWLIRPFLEVSKAEILDYLSECNQSWCVDSTNSDLSLLRNRVRGEWIPLLQKGNPRLIDALCRTAQYVREDAAYLDSIAKAAYATQTDRFSIAKLPYAVRIRVLKQYLPYDSFDRNDLETLDALLLSQTGTVRFLKNGWMAWVDANRLRIRRDVEESYAFPVPVGSAVSVPGGTLCVRSAARATFPCENGVLYIDADQVVGALSVRTMQPRDRFTPYGMQGSKLLSDFFTDRKVPRFERSVPLLTDARGIVAVIGFTVDDRMKVTENTTAVYRIDYEED